jgi:hypothetical protein
MQAAGVGLLGVLGGDGLDALVIGSDAVADEPVGGRRSNMSTCGVSSGWASSSAVAKNPTGPAPTTATRSLVMAGPPGH